MVPGGKSHHHLINGPMYWFSDGNMRHEKHFFLGSHVCFINPYFSLIRQRRDPNITILVGVYI